MKNRVAKPINIAQGKIVVGNTNAAIMQVLMVLLTFFTLLTPRDTLGLKKLFLGLALLFGVGPIIKGLGKNRNILIFAVVLPALMYCISTIDTGSPILAFSYLYPFVYLLLVFPIIEWNIDIKKIVLCAGNIMAVIIILSCLLDFVGVLSIYNNSLLMWLHSNGEAQISKSMYAMFRYVLFFNASPILFFNLTDNIKENRKISIAFIFTAILFTGTRANIYLGAVLLVFGMLVLSKRLTTKVVIILGSIAVIVFFGSELIQRYHLLAFAKAGGDLSRTGGMNSIIDAMNSHKSYWLTGMGFGSQYYNVGRMAMVETSELSYLEFIREIGLPLAILVFGYLIYPLFKNIRSEKFLTVSYGAYLIAGIFEPFIFTSTGFLIVMMVYANMLRPIKT